MISISMFCYILTYLLYSCDLGYSTMLCFIEYYVIFVIFYNSQAMPLFGYNHQMWVISDFIISPVTILLVLVLNFVRLLGSRIVPSGFSTMSVYVSLRRLGHFNFCPIVLSVEIVYIFTTSSDMSS